MKLYAELRNRRLGQIAMDAGMLLWIWWWASVGVNVASRFATAGQTHGATLEKSGKDIVTRVNEIAGTAAMVPLVGETLSTQLGKLVGVGQDVEKMGPQMSEQLGQLGALLGTLTAGLPILFLLGFWARGRAKYAWVTTRTVPADRTSPDAIERLSLLALVHRDAAKVARVHPRAMQEWRDGNMTVMRQLAALELRERGLVMPEDPRRQVATRADTEPRGTVDEVTASPAPVDAAGSAGSGDLVDSPDPGVSADSGESATAAEAPEPRGPRERD